MKRPTNQESGNIKKYIAEPGVKKKKLKKTALPDGEVRPWSYYEIFPIPYQSLDENGYLIDVNSVWIEKLGYQHDEVLGRWFGDFLIPEHAGYFEHLFFLFKAAGEIQETELEVLRKDGSIVVAIFNGRVEYDNGAKFKQAHCIFQDITAYKQAEKALRESERKYRNLFDNSIEGITVSRGSQTIDANQALLDIFGYATLEEFVNVPILDHLALESREAMEERLKGWSSNKFVPSRYECKVIRKNGTIRELEISAKEIVIDNLKYRQSTFRDITEHKQAEKALRESERKYRNLFDNSIEGITVSRGSQTIDANQALLDIFGYATLEEFVNVPILDHLALESREAMEERLKGWSSNKFVPSRYECKVIRKNGTIRELEILGNELVIGNSKYWQSTFRDITDRKRAEMELRRSSRQLRSLAAHLQSVREEERSNIAREIHDELGQVLTVLKMDLSWLSKRVSLEENILSEKVESMLKLINTTIHTVKRISAELRPGLLDDLGLVAAIEWQIEEFQKRGEITFEVNLESDEIIVDKDRATTIFRIFQETLTNIARHANATMVGVSLKEEVGNLVLKVTDNGKGITEKQIYNPQSFGLIGIKERVYQWGGEVSISGIQYQGTTVLVSIPINRVPSIERLGLPAGG